MEEINVVIPKEKLNDFNFIYSKLMDVKLEVLQTISKRTNRPFNDLVIEFVPEIKNFSDDFILKKYSINKYNLGNTDELISDSSDKLTDIVPVPKIVKKIIKKQPINKSPISKPDSVSYNVSDSVSEAKPTMLKSDINENSDINVNPVISNDISAPKIKKIIIKKQKQPTLE
jgi:hypothetical protein